YKLRPRYHPYWVPSWRIRKDPSNEYEDEIASYMSTPALDAIRVSDGKKVVLKRVPNDEEELQIAISLSSPHLLSDWRNRTIQILEVIPVASDSWTLLVMPYCRRFNDPPFHCRAEFIEAMQQYLEGLQFMHDQNIAHMRVVPPFPLGLMKLNLEPLFRDIAPQNLMIDESRVVPAGSHFIMPRTHSGFKRLFRWNNRYSVGPFDYYYIDFGLSMHFPHGQASASIVGTFRTFPTIPELSKTEPYNPFKVDIYQLGLTIQKIIETYWALRAFRPVATAMMTPDPEARPTPAQSLAQLTSIAARMSPRTLRASMLEKNGLLNHIIRCFTGGYSPSLPYH
ncbi:hypothetical protein DFH09DRAFT_897484, partial [Mycena vulgaris]